MSARCLQHARSFATTALSVIAEYQYCLHRFAVRRRNARGNDLGAATTFPVGLCGVLISMSFVRSEKAVLRASLGMLQSFVSKLTVKICAPARSAMGAYASYIGSRRMTYTEESISRYVAREQSTSPAGEEVTSSPGFTRPRKAAAKASVAPAVIRI